jgi:hypothetical protein
LSERQALVSRDFSQDGWVQLRSLDLYRAAGKRQCQISICHARRLGPQACPSVNSASRGIEDNQGRTRSFAGPSYSHSTLHRLEMTSVEPSGKGTAGRRRPGSLSVPRLSVSGCSGGNGTVLPSTSTPLSTGVSTWPCFRLTSLLSL